MAKRPTTKKAARRAARKTAKKVAPAPGVCIPWEQRVKEYKAILGDPEIVRKVWQETDLLAYLYIWAHVIQF